MRTRIISGVIGAVLLLAVLLQPVQVIVDICFSILCCLAIYELLHETKICKSTPILIVSELFSASVPFWHFFSINAVCAVVFFYLTCVGILHVVFHDNQSIVVSLFSALISILVSIALSAVAFVRSRENHGLFLTIWLLLIPWMSDTGAYFVGVCLGRHKLCPVISPKKTIEGLVGGLLTSVVICSVITILYNSLWSKSGSLNVWLVAVVTLLGAVLSVFGDLTASLIKRECNIKDFGKIMPGHGGIMDRFDSLMYTAPLVLLALSILPIC